MLQLIKELLLNIIDNIDAGNSNLTEKEEIQLIEELKYLTTKDEKLSKYKSCLYLNISRASFDNLVRENKLPRGKHEAGFKEIFWFKKDLDEYIKLKRNEYKSKKKI